MQLVSSPVRRAGSKQLMSDRAGALIFGRVGVAGNNDVNRVWHVNFTTSPHFGGDAESVAPETSTAGVSKLNGSK